MKWPLELLALRVLEVFDEDVRARKDLGLVPVLPAYEVRRRSVLAEYLQDLAVALPFALVVSPDDQTITWACAQC
jgi:hypothetical protein